MPSGRNRLLTVCLCLLALTGLCIAYGAADLWDTPREEELAATTPSSDQAIFLFVDVEQVDHAANTITAILVNEEPTAITRIGLTIASIDQTHDERTVTIHLPPDTDAATIHPGTEIQVAGTLSGNTIHADTIVQDYPTTTAWTYVMRTSLLGALIAIAAFLVHWRIDSLTASFSPRSDTDG